MAPWFGNAPQRCVELVELPLSLGSERATVELAHTPRVGVVRTRSKKTQWVDKVMA